MIFVALVVLALVATAAGIAGYLLGARGEAAALVEADHRAAELAKRIERLDGTVWACFSDQHTVLVRAATEDGAEYQAQGVLGALGHGTTVRRMVPVTTSVLPLVCDLSAVEP